MFSSGSRSAPAPRRLGLVVLLLLGLAVAPLHAQLTPDQMADQLLDTARRAFNEKNYPFAAERFKEFLNRFGNHRNAPAARYGLALTLLEGPVRDHATAIQNLQPLADQAAFPEQPFALYYLGLAYRGQGIQELAEGVAKPQEANQRRQNAAARFDEAGRRFAGALAAFTARLKSAPDEKQPLPADFEWAARARCDQAEMLVRTGKFKEARALLEPFLKDAALARSRYRPEGLYYHGFACFLLDDRESAGRSLSPLGPFEQPTYGTHARYLLARVHHLAGERAEAARDYEGVLATHEKQKVAAVEALKQPDRFRNDPEEKARLEALARNVTPDHVARAAFFLGVLDYENGKFADALGRFTAFIQAQPTSPLVPEATLRQGFCQVQLRQFAEALKILPPLADRAPTLADQALLWTGKAQIGLADPANAPAYEQALRAATDTFRRAADRANQLAAGDPDARRRRGEILLELADTQQLVRQHKEAAGTYQQILQDKLLAAREEEVLQRICTALHLAGDYPAADQACQRFQQTYPESPLLSAVLFRFAENAAFAALAAEKNPNLPDRDNTLAKMNDEAAKRYQVVLDRFPESPHLALCRYGLAQSYYRKADFAKAQQVLEAIPPADRSGELTAVPYVLADCLLRQAPERADDALAAGQLQSTLQKAIELLGGFVANQPPPAQTPDALVMLGLCHQRMAGLLAMEQERNKSVADARAAYERVLQQFPQSPAAPQATFERARCMALAGDRGGAINEMRRFLGDPLRSSPPAPMAVVALGTLLRGQNQAAEAVNALTQGRQQLEGLLNNDPARREWVHLLRYHHAVALRESTKLPEAQALFAQVVREAGTLSVAAEAALRQAQCQKDQAMQKLAAAENRLAVPGIKQPEADAANRDRDAALKELRDTVQFLDSQAEQWKQKQPVAAARARMYYESAWCARTVADRETAVARDRLQEERWKKLKDEAAKAAKPGEAPRAVPAPDVPPKDVPVQPYEQKARASYQALIAAFSDLPLAQDARYELAELMAAREEYEPAVNLLSEALDYEPSPVLTDKIRLRLGDFALARKDLETALRQFRQVAQNEKSPLAGHGHYRAAECLIRQEQWNEAIKHLAVFRDQGPFQNLPGLSDHALLRLGHLYARLKQWDQSRQAFEQVVGRFGNSPWVNEARYGMGWAWQNQGQFDQAVNTYNQVIGQTAAEVAARAQLQIGLCRLSQKRYPEATTALLVVPFTYDYPEWSVIALSEAARAFVEQKDPEQAVRLLERLLRDYPDSPWADSARERLQALKQG